jgi:tetratricopeptide (TPR) repeat protein
MYASTGLWLIVTTCMATDPSVDRFRVGETAIVVRTAEITAQERVVERVHPGLPLQIEARERRRYWVSHKAAGWIDADKIATPDNALKIFAEQIREHPDEPQGYAARGAVLTMLQRYSDAVRDYDQLIRLAPDVANSYACRGACWSLQNKHDKAIEDYTTAIRIDPRDPIFFNNRATGWLHLSYFDRAIADADAALRLSPQLETAYTTRAMAHAGQRDYLRATADCEAADRLNPRSASGFNAVAWFLATNQRADCRNGEKAVEFAKQACIVTDWKNASHLDTLAAAFAEAGELKEAVEWGQRAVKLAPPADRADYAERLRLYQRGQAYHQVAVE